MADRAFGSRGRAAAVPALIAVVTFAVCYGLALAFSHARVFEYVDVLFDTDAAWFLRGFSDGSGTGMGWGARSLVHPNVANLINPPLRLIAALCSGAGLCGDPAELVRARLALFVSPAAAAGEAVFVFLAVRTFSGSQVRAVLAALLNVALFPTLVFGAVPESFALTGCAFAGVLYLASRTATGNPVHRGWWALAGIALSSITITNIWLFALAYAVAHSGDRWFTTRAGWDAMRVSAIAMVCTGAIALTMGSAYGALSEYHTDLQQLGEIRADRQDVTKRHWTEAARVELGLVASGAFQAFPRSLGDTIAPTRPSIHGTALGLDTASGSLGVRSEPSLHANFRSTSADWGTFVALAALLGAAMAAAGCRGPERRVYHVAMALILGNWAFHSGFGIELFLYAKHWSVPVAILLAAWGGVKRPMASAGLVVVVLLLLLAVARDVRALDHVFRALHGA